MLAVLGLFASAVAPVVTKAAGPDASWKTGGASAPYRATFVRVGGGDMLLAQEGQTETEDRSAIERGNKAAPVQVKTGRIAVTVNDDASAAIEGAVVEIWDENGKVIASGHTNANGYVEFKGISTGKVRVVAGKPGYRRNAKTRTLTANGLAPKIELRPQ